MTNKLVSKRELEIGLVMRPTWELKDLFNLIDRMPLVDGGFTRHGHWIKDRLVSTSGGTYGVYRCSKCEWYGQDIGYSFNYCPNCGAKMDEVVEDEID